MAKMTKAKARKRAKEIGSKGERMFQAGWITITEYIKIIDWRNRALKKLK